MLDDHVYTDDGVFGRYRRTLRAGARPSRGASLSCAAPDLMPKKTLPAELVDPDGSIARRKLADIYDDSLRDELPVFAPEDTSCVACADPITAEH